MGRKKQVPADEGQQATTASAPGASEGKKVKKTDLIRAMFARGMTKPAEIIAAIKMEHGVEVSQGLIQAAKQTKGAKKANVEQRGGGISAGGTPRATVAPSSSANGSVGDFLSLLDLVKKIGKAQVQEIIDRL